MKRTSAIAEFAAFCKHCTEVACHTSGTTRRSSQNAKAKKPASTPQAGITFDLGNKETRRSALPDYSPIIRTFAVFVKSYRSLRTDCSVTQTRKRRAIASGARPEGPGALLPRRSRNDETARVIPTPCIQAGKQCSAELQNSTHKPHNTKNMKRVAAPSMSAPMIVLQRPSQTILLTFRGFSVHPKPRSQERRWSMRLIEVDANRW